MLSCLQDVVLDICFRGLVIGLSWSRIGGQTLRESQGCLISVAGCDRLEGLGLGLRILVLIEGVTSLYH